MLVGRVLFAVGLAAVAAVVVHYAVAGSAPLWLALLALLAPVGFGTALVGLLRSLRQQRRAVAERVASSPYPASDTK
jgi:hypothetical protein